MSEVIENISEDKRSMAEGIEWLMKAGILEHPSVQNAILLNILVTDELIEDAQLICDTNESKLLVYIELTKPRGIWQKLKLLFLNYFTNFSYTKMKEISKNILNKLQEAIPAYDVRITFDRDLYEKSLGASKKNLDFQTAVFKDRK